MAPRLHLEGAERGENVQERRKVLALLIFTLMPAGAADLRPETAKAWVQYVASVDAQMRARLSATSCFLWAEESPRRMERLRAGEIVIAPADQQTPRHIPGGLIHHWIGAVFIPGVTLSEVLSGVRDYGKYTEYYPSVVSSKLDSRDGTTDRFTSVERHQAMFSNHIALDADFSAIYFPAGDKRAYSTSSTTRLQQIDSYGSPGQHELGPDAPSAYLWALSTISRYEERDGGVYLELEAVALSREVPMGLGWLVDPFVRKASASTLIGSLKQTRDALAFGRATSGGAISAAVSLHP